MFTTLDLASGYLQVPLSESAKEKTAFITPSESGQFERMVFGLVNAPYEFSRLMQRVLHPLKDKVAMWYLDDILVLSTSIPDMLNRLQQVLYSVPNKSAPRWRIQMNRGATSGPPGRVYSLCDWSPIVVRIRRRRRCCRRRRRTVF